MANTYRGRKISISTTATPNDLTGPQFLALVYTEVKNVGSIGETGTQTNILSYDELSTDVTAKQKGISNAGDPVIECARNPIDAGQIAMRAAAITKNYYAFKLEDADGITTNSIFYQRGTVTGPVRPGGRNEDFILENYTLGLVQKEVTVDSTLLMITPEGGGDPTPLDPGQIGEGLGPDRLPPEIAERLTLHIPEPPPEPDPGEARIDEVMQRDAAEPEPAPPQPPAPQPAPPQPAPPARPAPQPALPARPVPPRR